MSGSLKIILKITIVIWLSNENLACLRDAMMYMFCLHYFLWPTFFSKKCKCQINVNPFNPWKVESNQTLFHLLNWLSFLILTSTSSCLLLRKCPPLKTNFPCLQVLYKSTRWTQMQQLWYYSKNKVYQQVIDVIEKITEWTLLLN